MNIAGLLAFLVCRGRDADALDLENGDGSSERLSEKRPRYMPRTQTTDTIELYEEEDSPDSTPRWESEQTTDFYSRLKARLAAVKDFLLQHDEESDSEDTPNYRLLPIISGIVVPFSILLEIPGITEHWYVITENNKVVVSRRNSALLDAGMSISMACALIANIALICRFLEKKVRTSTLVAIAGLTVHDIVNIVAVTVFGVVHRFNDGFTYGQSFWFTVCSTIASVVTNITLIIDYVRTPNFARASSGLTRKQRSLVIVVILLLVWIAVGGAVNSVLIGLSFIDGMYFTVVVIETIGFGDLVPVSTGGKVFTAFHAVIGILLLALTIGICRDTVIESFEASYRNQVHAFGERHKIRMEQRKRRLARREAYKRQLEKVGKPLFTGRDGHGVGFKHLNVKALTPEQKDAALLESEEILNGPEGENLERRSTFSSQRKFEEEIADGLQKEFVVKLAVVWSLFLLFWLIGAAIFMATEEWSYGLALWFCFESFSTIGFGDRTPVTPAGRSIFIVWALLGVGTMTILISVLAEGFSSRYEKAIQSRVKRAVNKGKEELEKVLPVNLSPDSERGSDSGDNIARGRSSESEFLPRRSSSCPQLRQRRSGSDLQKALAGTDASQLAPSPASGRIARVDFAKNDKTMPNIRTSNRS